PTRRHLNRSSTRPALSATEQSLSSFFTATPPTDLYTLSLHDALPIFPQDGFFCNNANSAISREAWERYRFDESVTGLEDMELARDRKSTRLNSSHVKISYAVFCLKKKRDWA